MHTKLKVTALAGVLASALAVTALPQAKADESHPNNETHNVACDAPDGFACLAVRNNSDITVRTAVFQKWTDGTSFMWWCEEVPAKTTTYITDHGYVGVGTQYTVSSVRADIAGSLACAADELEWTGSSATVLGPKTNKQSSGWITEKVLVSTGAFRRN